VASLQAEVAGNLRWLLEGSKEVDGSKRKEQVVLTLAVKLLLSMVDSCC
jgi:hypothetical protein